MWGWSGTETDCPEKLGCLIPGSVQGKGQWGKSGWAKCSRSGLEATWSSGRHWHGQPPWQGVGTRWSLRFLQNQSSLYWNLDQFRTTAIQYTWFSTSSQLKTYLSGIKQKNVWEHQYVLSCHGGWCMSYNCFACLLLLHSCIPPNGEWVSLLSEMQQEQSETFKTKCHQSPETKHLKKIKFSHI